MTPGAAAPAGDAVTRVHDLARRLPKVELHVHIEGTMSPQRLGDLGRRHGLEIPPQAMQPMLGAEGERTFAEFLVSFIERMRVLRTPDDWCLLLDDLLRTQHAANVKYTEAFVTFWGALRGDYVLRDVLREMAAVERDWHAKGCALRLVMDAPRPFGADVALQLFKLAAADESGLCVGVGIGGDEMVEPAERFVEPFTFARDAGLLCTAHAGEHGGPDSVAAAVDVLGVTRIGHGVAAATRPALLAHLRDRGVAVDVCPGSNRATGAWDPAQGPHPLHAFLAHGVRIDVGSDDPGIFGNDVCSEWADLVLRDGISPHRCFELTLDALNAAFLDDAHRARLRAHMEAELEDLREEAVELEEGLAAMRA